MTIKTKITENLTETLNNIRISSGYENDATAEGEAVRGNPPQDRSILVVDDGDVPIADSPLNKDDYTANYTVKCFITTSDGSESQPYPPELQQLVAEVRKALNADYTRGGWAINTITGTDSPPQQDERAGYSQRDLQVQVHYRTTKDDPTRP